MKNIYSNKTQKLAADILKKHVETGRVSQAYFFSGEELSFDPETGFSRKEELVYDFAARLIGGLADEKNRLKRIYEDQHPDVLRLGADPDMTSIKIKDDILPLLKWVSLKPFEGERRVGILCRADKLTDEAANAFLKTLEEAPGSAVFCLLAPSRELVLETIRSRCFEVRFPETPAWNPAAVSALPPFKEMLDNYSDLPKAELKPALDLVLENVRQKMHKVIHASAPSAGKAPAYLKAFQTVCEAKSALEANANAKLSVTRMVMKLRHAFSGERGIL